ncbi:acetyl-CoA hydrolase/transferase [Loa loa]|uniref:Acetyl-CoA hydrolase/transferase n=1 Tax=Loa loa TaxID=7209 RepID=A0A1S0TNI6_LOALO|nr:acetyl-CoA hydrolase/transferase [Loa loa]EFO17040.1 acetyl-CoA hydrolase/transferase [Loa loa]
MLPNMNYLNRFIPVAFRRTFSISAVTPRSTRGGVEGREVTYPIADKKPKYVKECKDAVSIIKSGSHIFVHGIAATPTPLLEGLCEHVKANNFKKITLHHMHLEGHTPWLAADVKDRIRSNSLFTGHNLRGAVNDGTADFNSIFLHEIPLLFRSGMIHLNAALITVSPPDSNGFCTLGTGADSTRAAVTLADYVIAICNKNMPRTFGDTVIHESHIDFMVVNDFSLHERIGAVPDAALNALSNHKNLGIHTEMFSDGILKLVQCNAITNAKKTLHPGKMVVSFVYGSKKLYSFLHDNPFVFFGDVAWVNDPSIVKTMPKMTAINSAVEIDLTGQVVSDSVGSRFLSGFGGQVDFIRGAALSIDGLGKPIIALPSLTKKGESKIVPYLSKGAGVVTSRAHVHYVVTEYGIAQLWGKNMRQRAYELIRISHPSQREQLEKAAFERMKVMPSSD